MSVDTRTPRTSGGRSSGAGSGGSRGFFDDEPVLSTVKVPSDPAEVVVNHASFRVRLGSASAAAPSATALAPTGPAALRPAAHRPVPGPAFEDTEPIPAVAAASSAAGTASGRRRAPLVWTGQAGPEDTGATKLLQAVRTAGDTGTRTVPGGDPHATRAVPRVGGPGGRPGPASTVGPPRSPQPSEAEPLLKGVRPARGAFDEPDTGELETVGTVDGPEPGDTEEQRRRDSVRHAYYPGRRMNLGVVLLPLRIFLGFITVYAGMGKLCDPVYFDGGERGSLVTWLRGLHPWTIASPLHDFALAHPVGAGLTVAFLQVIVGVLTMFGLWQRLAAAVGALLSVALLMTVSWSSVPAYEAPDIIYLAAWSPLIIAGAPVYSADGRLAGDAWRKLGPRVEVRDLRRRVLRRGAVMATVIVGLALLIGSLLGSAVRSSQSPATPRQGDVPVNRLPGSPMPSVPGEKSGPGGSTQGPGARTPGGKDEDDARHDRRRPSAAETRPGEQRSTAGPESSAPSQGQSQGGQQSGPGAAQQQSAPPQQQRTPQEPQTSSSGSAGPQDSGARSSSAADDGDGGSSSGDGSSSGGGGGGALGGLLGR
ncbi:hypothetical protein DEH18_01545 [Streptomyces sp. NHF165]|nr:DoxX family protein [Streptomyces sp. NHF165]QHF92808.1 hypothetical protein DEH18_01545 [Streptomyces sp. NHF165]